MRASVASRFVASGCVDERRAECGRQQAPASEWHRLSDVIGRVLAEVGAHEAARKPN